MNCPKCKASMRWEHESYITAGAVPAHWSCLKCGEVVWPDLQKITRSLSDAISGKLSYLSDSKEETMAKQCKKCGKMKELADFNKNAAVDDGHERTCRECTKEIQAAGRERRRKERHGIKTRLGRKAAGGREGRTVDIFNNPGAKVAPSEVLYLDPAAIRSIKKSVASQIYAEFGEFLKERYA